MSDDENDMSYFVSKEGKDYTFFIRSLYDPGNVTAQARNKHTAAHRAVMKHYGYDQFMSLKAFRKWVINGPQDFVPTAMMIHDDIVRVLGELNHIKLWGTLSPKV